MLDKSDEPRSQCRGLSEEHEDARGENLYRRATMAAYRFPELSPNVDYEVYAQSDGEKSDTKTLSQFDDPPKANIVLRIDTNK